MADRWVFDVNGSIGKAALYTVPDTNIADDTPLTAPRSHLSRVRFHTDFDYPKIVSDTTYSLNLPTRTQGTRGEATHTLGTHGQAGAPLCFGTVLINNKWIPLFISTPVPGVSVAGNVPSHPVWQGRVISLGANATHILVHEFWVLSNLAGAGNDPGSTLSIRVLVTDEIL